MLLTVYVNQETAFVLRARGQSQFLSLRPGVADQATEEGALRQSIGGDAQLVRDLDAVTQARRNWQMQFADPAIQATRSGQNTYASEFELAQSKALFDQVRATVATASQDLQAERQRATDRLSRTADELAAFLIASVVVLVLTGVLLWRALRRWVTSR